MAKKKSGKKSAKTNKQSSKKKSVNRNSKNKINKKNKSNKQKNTKNKGLNNIKLPPVKKSETYKKKIIILSSLVIVLGAIIILMNLSINFETSEKCIKDSDCIKVQTTPCPCSAGGKEVCVPKSEKEKYQINHSEIPENIVCAQIYNCNPGNCECVHGNCSFNIKE